MSLPKPTSPGALLQTLFETRQPNTFGSIILAKYLCPALDALPPDQKTNLARILLEAEKRSFNDVPLRFDRLVLDSDDSSECDDPNDLETVDLEARSRRIRALEAENQPIAEEIAAWLAVLWRTGAERGLESKSVHSALTFCRDLNSEAIVSLEITDSRGKLIYEQLCPIRSHISWVWRELLIKRLSVGDVETILRKLDRETVDDILSWFPSKDNEDLGGKECYLNHWSADIQEIVVCKLKGLLEQLRDKADMVYDH